MRAAGVAAAIAAGLSLGASASADVVQVNFEGTVIEDLGNILPSVDPGARFTGVFQYDTNGAVFTPEGGGGQVTYHSMLSYSVTFFENAGGGGDEGGGGSITFIASELQSDIANETVTNDLPEFVNPQVIHDSYENRVALPTFDLGGNLLEAFIWGVFLDSTSGGPFTSTDLPTSLNLAGFGTGTFSFNKVDGTHFPIGSVSGDLTSLSSFIVPSPGAGALLAMGGLALVRRRR